MTEQTNSENTCLNCGEKLIGRSDKKFCDNYCRSNFNNKKKLSDFGYIRQVNNALKKNRRILKESIGSDKQVGKLNREALLVKGFQFKYFTHTYTNRKGDIYNYCYDYGYLPLEDDYFLIVRDQKVSS